MEGALLLAVCFVLGVPATRITGPGGVAVSPDCSNKALLLGPEEGAYFLAVCFVLGVPEIYITGPARIAVIPIERGGLEVRCGPK